MDAYVIEAKRTPIGRANAEKGIFRNVRADVLLADLLKNFVDKVVPAAAVSDVYIGCVGQHLEQGKNIARLASLLAGLAETIPGATINRLCGSSLQAFDFAATAVHTGQAEVILAGGVEHMHHVPMTASLDYHQGLLSRYEFPFINMGLTAEKVALAHGVTRAAQDEFALASHQKAVAAQKQGFFRAEILPVKAGEETVAEDQGPRSNSSLEALAALKPAFQENGTVTAGNSSQVSDGASLTVVASGEACRKYKLTPRAEVVAFTSVGVNPCLMGMGPVPAIQRLLAQTGLKISDIDLFEINEAFASQAIACVHTLGISMEKVNPWGGAIALGHPLGCTGTRLITTLLNGLEQRSGKYGIVSMCVGHGQGMATLLKRSVH
jgi:acetyl-CoA acyltransferase